MNPPIGSLLAEKGRAVLSIPATATIDEAVRAMNERKVGCVLVMEGDTLAGVFTERDVLLRVVGQPRALMAQPVAEVMTRNPKTVPPEMTIQDALAFISENRCRHLPVTDGGRVVGLVSQGDITRWLVQAHKAEAEHLMDYITGASRT
jgi:CBS domain-containing protein